MDFVIQWLWYLLAFVVGSALAWLITVMTINADFHVVDSPQPFPGPLAFDLRVRVESRRTVAHCLWLSDCQIADTAIVIVS